MKRLLILTILTAFTTSLMLSIGIKEYRKHLEPEKYLIEKATPIDGRIDTEFLIETFGPANEQ